MKPSTKHLLVILSFATVFSLLLTTVKAQNDVLVLEWEQHWPTYMIGGTCNFGTSNFYVGDVDNDGVIELITGGMTYSKPNYTANDLAAPMRIWNWNGKNFTLEVNYNWAGTLRSIYAADLNGDNKDEIITGATVTNGTRSHSAIRIWSWDNRDLVLMASCEGINARSISAGDVDSDGVPEILTAGTIHEDNATFARLAILALNGNQLVLEKSYKWRTGGDASANGIYAYDLDGDDVLEVLTSGYDHGLTNSSGQLSVWRWNGQELNVIADEEWRLVDDVYGVTVTGSPMGNTLAENVKVADVDSDGTPEIVTGGFAYDGQKMNAQLRIWSLKGGGLILEKSQEWFTDDITEIKCVSLSDVNGDGHVEIVSSGGSAVYGGFQNGTKPEMSQLRIWSWNGQALKLNQREDWTIGEGVYAWNVGTGDVDNDGTVEIVTVGCMYISTLCDPDLRIWSLSANASSEPSWTFMAEVAAIAIVISVSAGLYLLARRKRR